MEAGERYGDDVRSARRAAQGERAVARRGGALTVLEGDGGAGGGKLGAVALLQDARTQVRAQTLKVFQALQKQDWITLTALTRFSVTLGKIISGDTEAYLKGIVEGIDKDPEGRKTVDRVLNGLSEIAVGEPIIKGDRADVPTSSILTIDGKRVPFRGLAHMIKDGDVWKWDLTDSDDPGAVFEKGMGDLLGKP